MLGTVDNGTTTGATAFWPDPDHQIGVDSGARFGVVTDEGDLYGTRILEPSSSYPVVLKCVRGAGRR